VPSFGCDIGVHVEERCLYEELIGIPRQRLRKKFKASDNEFETLYGVGYRFKEL
jgi:hypothetical protein